MGLAVRADQSAMVARVEPAEIMACREFRHSISSQLVALAARVVKPER